MQNKIRINNQTGVIIPDMASFIRDVTDRGNLGALIARIRNLGLKGILTLGWWNVKNILHLAKMEFAYGVLLLIEIEILNLKHQKIEYVLISDQITDLSVALKTKVILENSLRILKKIKPELRVGVMTNNFVRSVNQFYEWRLEVDLVVTPINQSGYEMNPTQKEVEGVIMMNDKNKIAALITRRRKEEMKYLIKLGIRNLASRI